MLIDVYQAIAATLCISQYALAAVAIGLCITLFRRTRNVGWLFLGMLLIEPFYFMAVRFAHGSPLLSYRTMGPGAHGAAVNMTFSFDIPVFQIFAVAGLLLLLRAAKRESRD